MVVIIVHHESTFVSYLIAITLRLYFNAHFRWIKIIIIENAQGNAVMKNQSNHDIQPWCGVNTFNNLHLNNREFLVDHFLHRYLLHQASQFVIYPLDLVNLIDQKSNMNNMDRPFLSHLIRVRLSQGAGLAMIYHPILLANHLRQKLYSLGGVSMVTLAKGHSIYDVAKDVAMTSPKDTTVLLDFAGSSPMSSFGTLDSRIITNTNLSQVEYLESPLNVGRRPPSSLLWLPFVKSRVLPSVLEDIRLNFHVLDTFTTVTGVSRPNNDSKALDDIDLFYGLKTCDSALLVIHELMHRGVVQLPNSKF